MTAFDAALAGAGVGGAISLVATFLAHLLEEKRDWRSQLRRNYLELRSAVTWAMFPIFSPAGREQRLSSPVEATRWGEACRSVSGALLNMRAIVRGRSGWKSQLCRQIDLFATMFDALLKRYVIKGHVLEEPEARALSSLLREMERLVFRRDSSATLDVTEYDRRVSFYAENGLDAPYVRRTETGEVSE